MEFFDAARGATEPSAAELLGQLQRNGSRSRLLEVLDEVDDVCDRILEEEAAEPLDESLAALLDAVSGAEDAPPHFRRVHERVENGQTTWDRFWIRPTDEYRGYEIIQAAIAATVRDVDRDLAGTFSRETRD